MHQHSGRAGLQHERPADLPPLPVNLRSRHRRERRRRLLEHRLSLSCLMEQETSCNGVLHESDRR